MLYEVEKEGKQKWIKIQMQWGQKKVMPHFDFHVCAAYDFYVDTSVI